ncbi:uncharacterized protein [Spinacia oleracea]|uniref:Uncharacterized protein isoform X2 n=1 Tax=Spinacia oleracea TaxID=3562 RepID=A0ABM3QIL2_SPIOL|nr:uncharacterized protein LOC110799971 [Spinacia oleracea]XP_056683191.1 uncharacterized protein LOC110799971 isoform X2 [Spinacia oleracea]
MIDDIDNAKHARLIRKHILAQRRNRRGLASSPFPRDVQQRVAIQNLESTNGTQQRQILDLNIQQQTHQYARLHSNDGKDKAKLARFLRKNIMIQRRNGRASTSRSSSIDVRRLVTASIGIRQRQNLELHVQQQTHQSGLVKIDDGKDKAKVARLLRKDILTQRRNRRASTSRPSSRDVRRPFRRHVAASIGIHQRQSLELHGQQQIQQSAELQMDNGKDKTKLARLLRKHILTQRRNRRVSTCTPFSIDVGRPVSTTIDIASS